MGPEPSSASASTSSTSPTSKRSRDAEDEVYIDNLHSHKRYLSEIMASSLNGLTVGDALPDNIMTSPSRSESIFNLRDEFSLPSSPMSEDSDDSRFCETSVSTCSPQHESRPTSPVSPYRFQRPLSYLSCTAFTPYPSNNYAGTTVTPCSHPRQRGSDSEGRFPSSPTDICHSADLRRAALMRSVQMRTHPSGQEHAVNIELEDQPSTSFMKHGREYEIEDRSPLSISEPEYSIEKSCNMLNVNMNMKGNETAGLNAARLDYKN